MRTLFLFSTLWVLLSANQAFGDMFSDAQAKAAPGNKEATPCEQIKAKCTKAGYQSSVPKAQDGKDLDDDCFAPVINGSKIKGVDASMQLIQECLGSMPKKPLRPKH